MWTFGQSRAAFQALPRSEQDFWVNLAYRYTGFLDLAFGSAYFDCRATTGLALFHRSCVWLDWLGDPGAGRFPYWVDPDPPLSVDPSPVGHPIIELPVYDQFQMGPDYMSPYPREKYKIRRTYWTGCSRRRRNL